MLGIASLAGLGATNYALSSSCGTYNMTSGFADITNLSASITTTGRPVLIALVDDNSGSASFLNLGATGFSAGVVVGEANEFKVLRDDNGGGYNSIALPKFTAIGVTNASGNFEPKVAVSCLWHFDAPAAGLHTWKVQVKQNAEAGYGGGIGGKVVNAKLLVLEWGT